MLIVDSKIVSDQPHLTDRKRGIFTEHDRRYLTGQLEDPPSGNAEHQKRFKIRRRVKNAIYDFYLLNRYVSGKDAVKLWSETDDWIYRARRDRQRNDAPPYPELPMLVRCIREFLEFFTYYQISTGIREGEWLVEQAVQEAVNRAVRQYSFESMQKYREVDAELDWGVGETYFLYDYLDYIAQQLPDDSKEAKEQLLSLLRNRYLQSHHVRYISEVYM